MKLASDSLNAFLLASGSQQSFTFGSSTFFKDQAFEDLLHYEWVTAFIARRFEQWVLRRLRSAYAAIRVFLNDAESDLRTSSRAPSPAFTTNSSFAYEIAGILNANVQQTPPRSASSPLHEDEGWDRTLQDDLAQACRQPLPPSLPGSQTLSGVTIPPMSHQMVPPRPESPPMMPEPRVSKRPAFTFPKPVPANSGLPFTAATGDTANSHA